MQNNKLIIVLKVLSPAEMRLFDKFVRSPIYNRHEQVVKLFRFLRKAISGKIEDLTKEKVFEHLFPGEPFDMQKVHYINSYLLKVVEEFLAWQEWKEDETEKDIYLLKAYRKHQLDRLLVRNIEQSIKNLTKRPLRNANFHDQHYELQYARYNYTRTQGRTREFNLQELADAQEISFIAKKLKNACILMSHQAVVKKQYDMGLLEQVLEHVERNGLLDVPVVAIHYYAYKSLLNVGEENFVQLKHLLTAHAHCFVVSELRDIYMVAINYCIRQLNTGRLQYVKEVFDLYRSGLDVEVFFENGILSRWTYNNIIIAGLKLKDFDWVEQFIYNYKERLPKAHQEGSFNYNLAKYYFEKEDYEKAMPLLSQMEHDDVLHNLAAKTMLAKMYYRDKAFDALHNLLASLRTYVYRKKVLGYHRDNYLNITGFMKRLSGLKSYDKEKKQLLINDIKKAKVLTEKDWFLEQLGASKEVEEKATRV